MLDARRQSSSVVLIRKKSQNIEAKIAITDLEYLKHAIRYMLVHDMRRK